MLWLTTARQAGEEVCVCYHLGSVSEGPPPDGTPGPSESALRPVQRSPGVGSGPASQTPAPSSGKPLHLGRYCFLV